MEGIEDQIDQIDKGPEDLRTRGLTLGAGGGGVNMVFDLQSLFGLHVHSFTHWLRSRNPPPSSRIRAHKRGRYWSAKIDDISL